ncbi:hypothetical protein VPH35_064725 [Triticum aestivum]
MDALELRYRRYVLLATAVGDGEESVTPAALLAALEEPCGVVASEVVIEVACPPHDLWLTFSTEEKCTDIQFTRWSRFIRAEPGALEYRCKLSFEGLPNQSRTTVSVKAVLKDLGGELIEILPSTNRHELEVMAWLRDPFYVGKLVTVEISEPTLFNKQPESMDEYEAMQFDLGEYGPLSPKKKRTLLYPVLCHMKEVIDRGPLLAEDLPAEWLPAEGEDLSRKHIFKTELGKIDGIGESEAV